MSAEVKKYEIVILGESITVVSDQEEKIVRSSAAKVEEIIHDIAQKAPYLEQKKIAILAALKISSMLVTCEYELEALKNQSQQLLNKVEKELLVYSFV